MTSRSESRKWACPNCGAKIEKHGRGGDGACEEGTAGSCAGFVCECRSDGGGAHGTDADPCPNAACYHCGWGGTFPPPKFDPARLKGWAKTAWAEGWRPPIGWAPKSNKRGGES